MTYDVGNPCIVNPDELEGVKVERDRYKQAAELLSRPVIWGMSSLIIALLYVIIIADRNIVVKRNL